MAKSKRGSINHEKSLDAFQEISKFLITMKQLGDYYLEAFEIAIDSICRSSAYAIKQDIGTSKS
jgi:hypothetical protein